MFKGSIFHCHVSLLEGKWIRKNESNPEFSDQLFEGNVMAIVCFTKSILSCPIFRRHMSNGATKRTAHDIPLNPGWDKWGSFYWLMFKYQKKYWAGIIPYIQQITRLNWPGELIS